LWLLGIDTIKYLLSYITYINIAKFGLFTSSFTILFCLLCAFALTKFHTNAIVIPNNIPFKKFLLFLQRVAQTNEYEWYYSLFIGHARFQLLVLVFCTTGYYIIPNS
jgi:hypothetical protein